MVKGNSFQLIVLEKWISQWVDGEKETDSYLTPQVTFTLRLIMMDDIDRQTTICVDIGKQNPGE